MPPNVNPSQSYWASPATWIVLCMMAGTCSMMIGSTSPLDLVTTALWSRGMLWRPSSHMAYSKSLQHLHALCGKSWNWKVKIPWPGKSWNKDMVVESSGNVLEEILCRHNFVFFCGKLRWTVLASRYEPASMSCRVPCNHLSCCWSNNVEPSVLWSCWRLKRFKLSIIALYGITSHCFAHSSRMEKTCLGLGLSRRKGTAVWTFILTSDYDVANQQFVKVMMFNVLKFRD